MFDALTTAHPLVSALIDAAWVALTVFFAISGFVLARRYSTMRWTRSAVERYAVARFGRVYPVYFFSLMILLPIMIDALQGNALGSRLDRFWLLANHVLLLQGWERPAVNWNTPAWSLSCEVFFYACFPLVIVPLRRASWARLTVALGLAFLIPIALRHWIAPPIAKPLLYFGDFLIGVVAARLYDRLQTRGVSLSTVGPWLSGPALAGGLGLLIYRDALPSYLVFDSGVRLASAALVFGLACGGGLVWRLLSSPWLTAGGHASYAIYILHVPVLWWYERSTLRAELSPVLAGVIYVCWVLVLSFVVSRRYEMPANAIVRSWYARRTAPPEVVPVDGRPPRSRMTLGEG